MEMNFLSEYSTKVDGISTVPISLSMETLNKSSTNMMIPWFKWKWSTQLFSLKNGDCPYWTGKVSKESNQKSAWSPSKRLMAWTSHGAYQLVRDRSFRALEMILGTDLCSMGFMTFIRLSKLKHRASERDNLETKGSFLPGTVKVL